MSGSPDKFAQLLTEAVYRIRSLEAKSVRIVQDELGYALDKKGGSSIEHWRKGFIPSKHTDVELLAREIIDRSDLGQEWLHQFLISANYPYTARLSDELFPPEIDRGGGASEVGGAPTWEQSLPDPLDGPYYNNLAPQPTRFIGRERELATIVEHLTEETSRLVTLVGPGGIGKTRLAVQAALHVVDQDKKLPKTHQIFRHGACFISLASLQTADFIVSTIADILDFSFFSGEDTEEQLLSFLANKKMLLIFDNLEHFVEEVDLLAKILSRAPGVKILATSRERLSLQGEWVIEVRGLQYPQIDGDQMPIQVARILRTYDITASGDLQIDANVAKSGEDGDHDAADYSALQLFFQSASRVSSTFEPTETDIPYIVEICRLVEGIPLAIELAASWARVLTCEEIATEISKGYDFLATSWRDIPERHRSLQAVFNYSWGLLSPKEQDTIRKLAVFENGFNREGAEYVANTNLHTLLALVDKSLLQRQPVKREGASLRYEMHNLLQQYARDKLKAQKEEEEETRGRLCSYFGDVLNKNRPYLRSQKQTEILEAISEDMENIRAGWNWAVSHKLYRELNNYEEGLFYFYDTRSWVQEGEEAFRVALNTLNVVVAENATEEIQALQGKVQARLGRFCYRMGDYEQARLLLQLALSIAQQYDIAHEVAFCLNHLGNVARRLNEYTEAQQLCNQALIICRAKNFNWGKAEALQILGDVAEEASGDYEESKRLHQEGLAISKELGDQRGIAASLNKLGYLYWHLGDYELAQQNCAESLRICQDVGDRWGLSMTLKNLGNIAWAQGNNEQATDYYSAGLTISREIGHKWGVAVFYNNLGNVAWREERYEDAEKLCQQSLQLWREMKFQAGMAGSLDTLASISRAMGNLQASQKYHQEALQISIDIQAIPLALEILSGLVVLLQEQNEDVLAVKILSFVLQHSAADQVTKDKANTLLAGLATQLSPSMFAQAQKDGRVWTLNAIAQALMEKVNNFG
ncbi:MAG TPA: tetratricopeptide repeat protein [Anaerolineae bacterium]|nr:tetratricopeptide repeat protein [Anaerolineae bacterium]